MIDPSIPPALRNTIDRELEREERIDWIEMPQRVFFTPAATAAFLFGIPWTAFALFWTAGAAGFKFPVFNQGFDLFPLFGLPFILIGLGMLSLRDGCFVYVRCCTTSSIGIFALVSSPTRSECTPLI
jgi:hypothetical protein